MVSLMYGGEEIGQLEINSAKFPTGKNSHWNFRNHFMTSFLFNKERSFAKFWNWLSFKLKAHHSRALKYTACMPSERNLVSR